MTALSSSQDRVKLRLVRPRAPRRARRLVLKLDSSSTYGHVPESTAAAASLLTPATKARFERLAAEWKRDASVWSSGTRRVLHPAYQKIIGLGPAVVPFLLQDLPNDWFYALWAVTGEDPVAKSDQGNIRAMSDAWLAWGHAHGYSD